MQVQANNTTLYAEDTGSGLPIVFVHGMCGDASIWSDQVDRLGSRYRCISYDRRGHTRSQRTADIEESVQLHADDLAGLIEAMSVERCLIVSSSGGARISVDLIRRYPHLVAGAVLSEPPIPNLAPQQFATLFEELPPLVKSAAQTGGPAAAVSAFFTFVCPGLWSSLDDAGKSRYRANAEMLFADLSMPRYHIGEADLAQICVPTLVIAGSTSHPALNAGAHNLAAQLANARLVELDCGHVTYAERPAEFAHLVDTFAQEIVRLVES